MFASQVATLASLKRFGRMGRLGELITLDSSQLSVPVLIPHTASPAVTGWDSNWLVAGLVGAAMLGGWGLFGSKVRPPDKKKPTPKGKKLKLKKKK